jgi:VWFA-related protein
MPPISRSLIQRFGKTLKPVFLLIVISTMLTAQQVPTYSVSVKVVSVLATVRDKHGNIINNLGKDDFALEEDGRPQTIKYFTRESDLPLSLGLLVDTSLSQRRVLEEERRASGEFTDDVLRVDKDASFLIHFDREVELLQDLTKSPQKIGEALQKLETPTLEQDLQQGGSGGGYPGAGGGGRARRGGGGTLLYDAIFLASDEVLRKQDGRKALVLLTDGVDTGSKESIDEAIEAAQRADTVVYSILFSDQQAYGNGGWSRGGGWGGPMGGGGGGRGGGHPGGGYPGGGGGYPRQMERPNGKKVLERISKETGGRLFEVSKKQSVGDIYKQIQDELRNQYSLGYTPDRAAGTEYRKIHVIAKPKDMVVQARDGYYLKEESVAGK